MFAYCLNNPVVYVDVSGYLPFDVIKLNQDASRSFAHYSDKPVSPVKVSAGALKDINVHEFKKSFVGNSVSQWDVFKDTANRSILWLGNKAQTTWIGTGYFLEDLFEQFSK